MAGWTLLRPLREHEDARGSEHEANALLVHGLPFLLQRPHRHCYERSKIPLRKWAIAIYLCLTSLKSVSSMRLHRDLKISQKTAWFMLHRLREAWVPKHNDDQFSGPVEVDETYMGGKRRNMSNEKRKGLTGRGAAGKVAIVGAKDRASNRVAAQVVESTDKPTLQGFVVEHTTSGCHGVHR